MKKIIILMLFGFIGAQLNAAGITFRNANAAFPIAIRFTQTDGKRPIYIVAPGGEDNIDAFLAGFTNVEVLSNNRIISTNLDIPGIHGWYKAAFEGNKLTLSTPGPISTDKVIDLK